MLLQLISGHSVCDRDNVKTCVTRTHNIVRSIANNDSPTCIERSAVSSGEPFGDHSRKLEPVTCVITERADIQIQMSVQPGYAKLDFGCNAQVSGQHRLHESVFMQRGNGIERTGIRWLITSKFLFPFGHDTSKYPGKPRNTLFCNLGRNPRSDSSLHHDRLIGVAMHA